MQYHALSECATNMHPSGFIYFASLFNPKLMKWNFVSQFCRSTFPKQIYLNIKGNLCRMNWFLNWGSSSEDGWFYILQITFSKVDFLNSEYLVVMLIISS